MALLTLLLAACGSETIVVTPVQPDPALDRTLPPPTAQLDAAPQPDGAAVGETAARPAWQTLPLVNARTGETFTLGDFAGRAVYVEPMATWCTNCRAQMTNLIQAQTQVDSTNLVYIGLSVETNISAADLASYADSYGFDWTFAVMTPEIVMALTETFGRTVTTPPATPHFMIYPDGTYSTLDTGSIETVDELAQLLREATA
jgi:thiol-disulfide isomerase/thioredoxin